MASWLPETLFEIVGQGPAPSKDYYQLLVTRFQASASRGFPSYQLSARPGGAWKASRARPREQPVVSRKRRVPAPSREISPRHLNLPCGPSGPRRPLLPTPSPARTRRAFLASSQRRPLPYRHPAFLPVEFPPREKKNSRPRLACSLSVSVGRRERKDSVKCPKEEPAREGRKGGFFFQGRV